MADFPDIIQIELTTECNFSCPMCIRNTWDEKAVRPFPTEDFIEFARVNFPKLKHVIFMGLGEILTHPDIIKIIDKTAEYLPENGTFEFTTNGALLDKNMLDAILEASRGKLYRIIMSIETPFLPKLKKIRPDADETVFDNLKSVGSARKEGKFKKLALESVVMKSNFHDLPALVRFASENHVDDIYVSHLLPHSREMESQILYHPISKELWEISRDFFDRSMQIIEGSAVNSELHAVYGDMSPQEEFLGMRLARELNALYENTKNKGISLNLTQIYRALKKSDLIEDVERVFRHAGDYARLKGVNLDLPPLFVEYHKRTCPYVSRNACIIDVHGNVIPCFNFLHSTPTYINGHIRYELVHSFGNIFEREFASIWNDGEYTDFRRRLSDSEFSANIPWCSDCPYSTANCFYTHDSTSDCYGNRPGCNECLYSGDMVRCIFDK